MRIVYRADGGHPIGTGHLLRATRVLTRLQQLCQVDARLLVAEDPAALRIAAQAPARLVTLPPRTNPEAQKPLLSAAPVLQEVQREPCDLIVVDMLDTPDEDMAALRSAGIPLLTFDDRGPGRRHANTLIDILVEEPEMESLPPDCRLLQGGPYVTLDPIFAELWGRLPQRTFGPLRRVMVAMGGADAAGLTVRVAQALRLLPYLEQVDFVMGSAFPHRRALEEAVQGAQWRAVLHNALPNLVDRYIEADLCVVAGGLTMWETCCVGAPSLAVCQPIDHQYELAAKLAAAGAMATAGYGLQASIEDLAAAVDELLPPTRRQAMADAGPKLIDGRGAERVARAFIDTARGIR